MQNIGSKTTGFTGRLAGTIMNLIHARQYGKIVKEYLIVRIISFDLSILL
jgi:hypothetical protein